MSDPAKSAGKSPTHRTASLGASVLGPAPDGLPPSAVPVAAYGSVTHPDILAAFQDGERYPKNFRVLPMQGVPHVEPDAEAANDLAHPALPGEAPADTVARIEAKARRLDTPCAEGSLVWRDFGGEGKPVLFLLHGGFGSWMHWLRNVLPLARHFRVIALDSPGLGDSASAPPGYTAESLTEIIVAGIERILPAGARFHVAGFSFGGLLGGHVAAWGGERCASYTFIGPGGLGLKRGLHLPLLKWRAVDSEEERLAVNRENLMRFMFVNESSADPLAVWIQTRNTEKARTKSRPIAASDTLARRLAHVRARKVGAWGDQDLSAWPYLEERRKLVEASGGRFVIIPNSGHWAMYEQPAHVNALIRRNALGAGYA